MILKIIFIAFKDFFDKKIFFISLIPLLISTILWSGVFYFFSEDINNYVANFLSDEKIRGVFLFVVEGIVFYELLIITSVMIVGIVADKIVDVVNEKYYHLEKRGFGKVTESIWISIKANIKFLLVFLFIFLPSLIIFPFISPFLHILLWMILIKEPMFYDSLSSFANNTEFTMIKNNNRFDLFIITLISASLFFIPIFGAFVYVWQLLIFTHFNLQKLKELR